MCTEHSPSPDAIAGIPEPAQSRKPTADSKLQLDRWIEKLKQFGGKCADCGTDLAVAASIPRPRQFLLQVWNGYRCGKCAKEITIAAVFSDGGIAQAYLDHAVIQQEVASAVPDFKFHLTASGLGYLANHCAECKTPQTDYFVYSWVRNKMSSGAKPQVEKWVPYSGDLLDTQELILSKEIVFPFIVADSYPFCPECHAIYLKKKANGEPIVLKNLPVADKDKDKDPTVLSNSDIGKIEMPNLIFHFARKNEWDQKSQEGGYGANLLSAKGYIAFCEPGEVARISSVKFRAETEIFLVAVDKDRLRPKIALQADEFGGESPHVLGQVNLDSIVATFRLDWKEDRNEHVIVREMPPADYL